MIREQIDPLVANYIQYLKRGEHHHYEHYFLTLYDSCRPGFYRRLFEFHNLIEHYQRLFGAKNVLLHTIGTYAFRA